MILIGLNEKQKQNEICKYVKEHDIQQVIVFSDEKFFMNLPETKCPIRQIGYNETIMYRTFYPLLEEIDSGYLLVMNEMMRDQNRSCLTYNCVAKYTNQTEHRMVFEYLPIIEQGKDIMILLDFATSQRYKGQSLGDIDLGEFDIRCVRRAYNLTPISIPLPDGGLELYEHERDRLFEDLGNKHPDTIPRNLHIWTGRFKKPFINPEAEYVARNARFKRKNITVYKNVESGRNYTLIDIPHRRIDFNDFLRRSGQTELKYLSTGLSVDMVYIKSFEEWKRRLEAIYAKTGVYSENS